jgi:geranylgeranyl diphosphate synthase type I
LAPSAIGELNLVSRVRLALHDWLAQALLAMLAGQSDDIAFEGRDDVSLSASEAMLMDKSGAELAFFARAGALLAGAPADVCDAYADFGRHWGTMIQVLSDCADLARDGAESRDLATGKRTLPVLYTIATLSGPARTEFLSHLDAAPVDPLRAQAARRTLSDTGAFHYGALAAEAHRYRALTALRAANPVGAAASTLFNLATDAANAPGVQAADNR